MILPLNMKAIGPDKIEYSAPVNVVFTSSHKKGEINTSHGQILKMEVCEWRNLFV